MKKADTATKVKELVLSYKDSKRWPELDTLYQLSRVLIEDSYVVSNIETRYKADGKSCLRNVKEDLRTRGVEDIDKVSEILGYFFSTRCGTDFESAVQGRIESLEPKLKLVVSELSLYQAGLLLAPKWTIKVCSWSIDAQEEETERKLVETGIVNRYYFHSNASSHPAWDIPDYVQLLLHRIRQSPESYSLNRFDIATIRGLAKDPGVRTFIEWILQKGHEAGLSLYVAEDEFEERLKEHGDELRRTIAKLARAGVLTLTYSPERKRVGNRSSKPADCCFDISLELVEAVAEIEQPRVGYTNS